jgi:hypothetical protein
MKSNIPKLATVAVLAAVSLQPPGVLAADHTDSPAAADDPAVDIADFYAWHTDGGRLVSVLTFAGLGEAGVAATYDAETLYGIHIDRDGDNASDRDIWFRFGQNGNGDWGVMATGIPGEDAPVSGAVQTNLDGAAGTQLFAGLTEDPFFFDFEGFGDTLATGDLAFDAERDSFAGTNVTAIVVEMDLDDAVDGAATLSMWATASRKN